MISPSESMGAQSLLIFPDRQHFECVVTPAAEGEVSTSCRTTASELLQAHAWLPPDFALRTSALCSFCFVASGCNKS